MILLYSEGRLTVHHQHEGKLTVGDSPTVPVPPSPSPSTRPTGSAGKTCRKSKLPAPVMVQMETMWIVCVFVSKVIHQEQLQCFLSQIHQEGATNKKNIVNKSMTTQQTYRDATCNINEIILITLPDHWRRQILYTLKLKTDSHP